MSSEPASPPSAASTRRPGMRPCCAGSIAVDGLDARQHRRATASSCGATCSRETTPPFASTPTDPRNGKIVHRQRRRSSTARVPTSRGLYPTMPAQLPRRLGLPDADVGPVGTRATGPTRLYAFAFDQERQRRHDRHARPIVVSNNAATKPFGSIDTPAIGGDACGPELRLGPDAEGQRRRDVQDPADRACRCSIDSGPLQPVVYGDARTDIARRLPGLLEHRRRRAATHHSTGRRSPTASHTIGWLITDDCNRADGVGSRFFNVRRRTRADGEF